MSTIRLDVREWRIVVRRYLVSSLVSRRLSSVRVVVTPSSVRDFRTIGFDEKEQCTDLNG